MAAVASKPLDLDYNPLLITPAEENAVKWLVSEPSLTPKTVELIFKTYVTDFPVDLNHPNPLMKRVSTEVHSMQSVASVLRDFKSLIALRDKVCVLCQKNTNAVIERINGYIYEFMKHTKNEFVPKKTLDLSAIEKSIENRKNKIVELNVIKDDKAQEALKAAEAVFSTGVVSTPEGYRALLKQTEGFPVDVQHKNKFMKELSLMVLNLQKAEPVMTDYRMMLKLSKAFIMNNMVQSLVVKYFAELSKESPIEILIRL